MEANDIYRRNRDPDDKQEFVDLRDASERPENGGDEGIRTLDLCVANAPLSHLSYIPTSGHCNKPSSFFNKNFQLSYLTRT
jgi:hypothetical protein